MSGAAAAVGFLSSERMIGFRLAGPLVGPMFSIGEAVGVVEIPPILEPYKKQLAVAEVGLGAWSVSTGALMLPAATAVGSTVAIPAIFVGGGAFSITKGIDELTGGRLHLMFTPRPREELPERPWYTVGPGRWR